MSGLSRLMSLTWHPRPKYALSKTSGSFYLMCVTFTMTPEDLDIQL